MSKKDRGYYSDYTVDITSPTSASASAFDTSDEDELDFISGSSQRQQQQQQQLHSVRRRTLSDEQKDQNDDFEAFQQDMAATREYDSNMDEYADYLADLETSQPTLMSPSSGDDNIERHRGRTKRSTEHAGGGFSARPAGGTLNHRTSRHLNNHSSNVPKGRMEAKFRKWKDKRDQKKKDKQNARMTALRRRRNSRLSALRKRRSSSLERSSSRRYSDGESYPSDKSEGGYSRQMRSSASSLSSKPKSKKIRHKIRHKVKAKVKRYFDDRREKRDQKREKRRKRKGSGDTHLESENEYSDRRRSTVNDINTEENALANKLKQKSKFRQKIRRWVKDRAERKDRLKNERKGTPRTQTQTRQDQSTAMLSPTSLLPLLSPTLLSPASPSSPSSPASPLSPAFLSTPSSPANPSTLSISSNTLSAISGMSATSLSHSSSRTIPRPTSRTLSDMATRKVDQDTVRKRRAETTTRTKEYEADGAMVLVKKEKKEKKGLARAKEKWKTWRTEHKSKRSKVRGSLSKGPLQHKKHLGGIGGGYEVVAISYDEDDHESLVPMEDEDEIKKNNSSGGDSGSSASRQGRGEGGGDQRGQGYGQNDEESKKNTTSTNLGHNKKKSKLPGLTKGMRSVEKFFRGERRQSPRSKLLEDAEISRPAMILNVLPYDRRLTAISELWCQIHSKQREKTLRTSGNLAVLTLEGQLCTVHRRGLVALVKSREPSELLVGYGVKKVGKRKRLMNRVQKVNERVKDGRKKITSQMKKTAKKTASAVLKKFHSLKGRRGDHERGDGDSGEKEEKNESVTQSTAYYFTLGKWVPRERLLRLTLAATKPPVVHVTGMCSACTACTLSDDACQMSDERLASQCSEVLRTLLRAHVSRRIGLQILHRLSTPLEAELYIYNQRHPGNRDIVKMLAGTPKRSKFKRKRLLKRQSVKQRRNRNGSGSLLSDDDEENEDEEDETVAEEHECPICVDLLCNPCVLRCEHVFCRLCLLKVAQSRLTKLLLPLCPLCREPFALNDIVVEDGVAKELSNLYNIVNGDQLYDERLEETMEFESAIEKEVNTMMKDRNFPDRVGDQERIVPLPNGGGSSINSSDSGGFLTFDIMVAMGVPMLTMMGQWMIEDGKFHLRVLVVLMCATLMTMFAFFFSSKTKAGRGILLIVSCFQWAWVVVELFAVRE